MMNIIIDGPDNVGKTTQIRNIKNYFNNLPFHTIHYSNIVQKSIEDTINYSKKLYKELFELLNSKYNFICDRCHLDELVYGNIYRGYSGDYVIELEKECNLDKLENLFLIILIDTPENLIKRDDGKSFSIDLDKKKKEIELFKEAFKKSTIKNKILIDINGKNENEVFDEIINFLKNFNIKGV